MREFERLKLKLLRRESRLLPDGTSCCCSTVCRLACPAVISLTMLGLILPRRPLELDAPNGKGVILLATKRSSQDLEEDTGLDQRQIYPT